jgi:hypothetical protein
MYRLAVDMTGYMLYFPMAPVKFRPTVTLARTTYQSSCALWLKTSKPTVHLSFPDRDTTYLNRPLRRADIHPSIKQVPTHTAVELFAHKRYRTSWTRHTSAHHVSQNPRQRARREYPRPAFSTPAEGKAADAVASCSIADPSRWR